MCTAVQALLKHSYRDWGLLNLAKVSLKQNEYEDREISKR